VRESGGDWEIVIELCSTGRPAMVIVEGDERVRVELAEVLTASGR
jgi:hypothetical protein